jgi:hypothetical protein
MTVMSKKCGTWHLELLPGESTDGSASATDRSSSAGRVNTDTRTPAATGPVRKELKEIGWTKGREAGEASTGPGSEARLCTLGAQSPFRGERRLHAGGGKGTNRTRDRAARDHLLQGDKSQVP